MKFKYCGFYKNDPEVLPHDELEKHPNAVEFKEIKDFKKFTTFINIVSIIIAAFTYFLFFARLKGALEPTTFIFALIGSLLTVIPHELLHAICMEGTVHMYFMSSGAFVTSSSPISKFRFIFMSMLPNIVFGFVPFIIYLINPYLHVLGFFGATCISMGAGDYYNVYNCLTQVPSNGMCFMHKLQTFWYVDGE